MCRDDPRSVARCVNLAKSRGAALSSKGAALRTSPPSHQPHLVTINMYSLFLHPPALWLHHRPERPERTRKLV
jgi:hypothetical protein